MKTRIALWVLLLATFNLQPSTAHAQGTAFTYQGRLNNGGTPVTGNYDLRFSLWTDITNGSNLTGFVTNSPVVVSNGLFTTTLDFRPDVFDGSPLWLQIGVRTNGATGGFNSLSPRQRLTPAPYAISAETLSGTVPASQISGVVSLAQLPAILVTNNATGVNLSGTFIGNGAGVTNLSLAGFYLPGGSFLGNSTDNSLAATATNSFLGGGWGNSIQTNANLSFLGGGEGNSIQPGAHHSFLGGGWGNSIQTNANLSFLGGGYNNSIQQWAWLSFLGGGNNNSIQNVNGAFLGGGYHNSIQQYADHSVLSGGYNNSIQPDADHSVLSGGYNNSIAGGYNFTMPNDCAAVLVGGSANSIQTNAHHAFLGGGYDNSIQPGAHYAFLGGGEYNTIGSGEAVLAGGIGNSIQPGAIYSFLGGGYFNSIQPSARSSFLGGGTLNTNGGAMSIVPGGDQNFAGGDYSFAAGRRAKANYQGDFVWADSQDVDFNSTDTDQFLIRAQGGVGINTTSPQTSLHVYSGSGTAVRVEASGGGGAVVSYDLATYPVGTNPPVAQVLATDNGNYSANLDLMTKTPGATANGLQSRLHIVADSGDVGIGTSNPQYLLDVNGPIHTPGNVYVQGWYYCMFGGNYLQLGTSSGNAVWQSSDERLKQEVATIPDALGALQKLRGVTWRWNDTGLEQLTRDIETKWKSASGKPEDDQKLWREKRAEEKARLSRTQTGFIAQEVERVFPDWVRTDEQGYKQINLEHLDAVLVNAVNEQQAEIAAQRQRLEAENAELRQDVAELKALVKSLAAKVNGGGF